MKQRALWNAMILCGLCLAAWTDSGWADDMHAEDAVKAAFTLRFASYVEWPGDPAPGEFFTIVVLGASEVALQMQAAAAGRTVMSRPIQVRRIASIHDVGAAQVLYVGSEHRGSLRDVIAPVAGRSLLIVSDEEYGLDYGSTINLRLADQRVRFEVSLPAARRAGLRISSELLALAARVQK